MLYQINNGTVSLGGREILSHIDFEIKGREKIAVVGRNGAGKTTLLRLLAGELELDRDDHRMEAGIRTSRKLTIGMLRQNFLFEETETLSDLLLKEYAAPVSEHAADRAIAASSRKNTPSADLFSPERFSFEAECSRILTGFGFSREDWKKPLSEFSGGERTKIALVRLLLQKPDILLLDEPTNHLDLRTVQWLEEYFRQYDRAVVYVSHDRYFLDQVAEVVYELSHGKLKKYHGNYTDYRQQKRRELESLRKAYERQEEEQKRLNDLIEKFKNKPRKAAFARSRKKILERMEHIEKPEEDDASIFTGPIEPLVPGSKWVLEAEELKIGYDAPLLELSARIRKGQKVGILGDNGTGKSTFLKTAAGLLPPLDGKIQLGRNTTLGYFDQMSAELASGKSVLEHFHDLFPSLSEKEVRQILGQYLFSGKKAAEAENSLSGGERARLQLAELLNRKPNFLILDEPTNHMDVPAKETLESAFQQYRGTILFVSHDRYFIRQVADALLVFENGEVQFYPFGYEQYRKKGQQQKGLRASDLVQAENQALLESFHALPGKGRPFEREPGTEEAYREWKLRLAAEQMEQARCMVEMLENERQSLLERMEWTEELAETERRLELACEEWTNQCILWDMEGDCGNQE